MWVFNNLPAMFSSIIYENKYVTTFSILVLFFVYWETKQNLIRTYYKIVLEIFETVDSSCQLQSIKPPLTFSWPCIKLNGWELSYRDTTVYILLISISFNYKVYQHSYSLKYLSSPTFQLYWQFGSNRF